MIRLRIAAMSVILALAVTSVAYAASAPKPGSVCKKRGQVVVSAGNQYTCIQSGKRLIWGKPKKVVAAPTPKPTSTPTQYVSPVRDAVSVEIDMLRSEVLSRKIRTTAKATWFFQGDTSEAIRSKTINTLEAAMPVYAQYGFTTNDVTVLVARDMNWVRERLTALGCRFSLLPERPGFYVSGPCAGGNGTITSSHWDVEKFSDGIDGLYFHHVLPHEYFHQVQEQLSRGGNGDFPKWFWEGSAQFFTNQIWASRNPQQGYVEWFEHWWTKLRPDLGPAACKEVTIAEMSDPSASGMANGCAYSKGQLLVELLIAKYGMEKYLGLYTASKPYEGPAQFESNFAKVTGIALNAFYSEAADFIKRRGW